MSIRSAITSRIRRASAWVSSLADRMDVSASQGWKAGEFNRAMMDFNGSTLGINAMADVNLKPLWARSRWLCEQDPIVKGAREAMRRNIVGDQGIYYEPKTGNTELNKILRDYFWTRAERVDKDRMRSLAAMQGEFYNTFFATGEAMSYFPIVSAWRGYDAGPCIELIDSADRVDIGFGQFGVGENSANGARIRQGVEFDAEGRVAAYHVFRDSPSDGGLFFSSFAQRDRVSAMDAHLAFMRLRSGQIRGVPPMVAAVLLSRQIDDFTNAALVLEHVRASLGVIFEGITPDVFKGKSGTPPVYDPAGNPITKLKPGTMICVPQGTKAQTLTPTMNGQMLSSVHQLLNQRLGSSVGLDYETLTSDRTKSTYAAGRSGAIENRKTFREMQGLLIHEQMTRPWWEREVMFGITSGAIKLTNEQLDYALADRHRLLNVSVVGPGWEWVDPLKEVTATEKALQNRLISFQDSCAERGKFWEDEQDKAIEAEERWNKRRAERGLLPAPLIVPAGSSQSPASNPAVNPADGADPSNPNAPAEPADPADPADPAEPADSTDTTDPNAPPGAGQEAA